MNHAATGTGSDIAPGIYPDIPNEQYHAGPGYSKSQLDLARKSPALVQWSRHAPRSFSDADHKGTAIHTLLLEPDSFDQRYAIGPDCDRRSKANKERWEEFETNLGDRTPLTIEERETLHEMHQSVLAHPEAASLLALPGESELSAYAHDPDTGLLVRIRPDRWSRQFRIMVDVKSTDDINKFHWSVRDYRYDVQQAFYTDVSCLASGEPLDAFLFLVVGKRREMGRYPVAVIELHPQHVDNARELYRDDLATIAECEARGHWPGVQTMTVPPRYPQ